MTVPATVTSILKILDITQANRKEAEAILDKFVTLKDEEKKVVRSATIEKLFPLVFGENALVPTSANFEELKKSTW